MLRNSKPIIRNLNEEQFKALVEMGFLKYYDSMRRPLDDINSTGFFKPYDVCGGTFELSINLERCCFCGTDIEPYVNIRTPYDRWWCSRYELSKFTSELEEFQRNLVEDIKKLRKLGIIS